MDLYAIKFSIFAVKPGTVEANGDKMYSSA